MTDAARRRRAPATRARARRRPARRAPLRPRRGPRPAPAHRQPDPRHLPRHPHRGPPAGRREPGRRRSARSPPERAHLAAVEALDPPGCPPAARFERDLELHNLRLRLFDARRGPPLGAPVARPPASSATRCSCCSPAGPRRWRSGSSGSRTASRPRPAFLEQARRRAPSGRQVAVWQQVEARYATDLPALFAEVRAAADGVLDARGAGPPRPGDRRRRTPRSRPTSPGSTGRSPTATDDWPLGARALRRAGPPAGLRRPGRRRDPGDRLGPAAHEPRGAAARPPASSTPTRTCRPSSTASRATTRPRSRTALDGYRDVDAPGARLPHRARHRHRPGRRGHRGHRHARVPAQRDAVRGLLLAGPLRRRPARHLRRHAGRRQRPQRDARALLGLDLEHQHPRGVPGPPPPAGGRGASTRASPGCSPTPPSSSRAGACTPSR